MSTDLCGPDGRAIATRSIYWLGNNCPGYYAALRKPKKQVVSCLAASKRVKILITKIFLFDFLLVQKFYLLKNYMSALQKKYTDDRRKHSNDGKQWAKTIRDYAEVDEAYNSFRGQNEKGAM